MSADQYQFLPPNMTSQLQPMDQGRSFSMNLLQTMRMCYKAWKNVEKNTIVNYFIKSGISTKEKEIKYTHLESDDGGSDWKLIVDHYIL
ncbi:tigger transposable element-derived protein 6-like [Aphis craccivora]|uniref:Tigger transposable element-derived protein 6-like n=1 Tax=Aphis craccivora TaxID=307492 RepID=A0A6G0Y8W1_APHCR|nr:tigger transposable element-derived protein 6-like [Aphis craccivora]